MNSAVTNITIKGISYKLPIYLPDATRAVTKGIDSNDLVLCGIRGVVVNTYHLKTTPGLNVLAKFAGVKGFMNFDGLVVSDSGGWQVFSLIHRSKKAGEITDDGVKFAIGGGSLEIFTPEESVKTQFEIGSDIIICLDDFSSPHFDYSQTKASVERTILWAKKSKAEYDQQLIARNLDNSNRPMLFAVVQGGNFKDLRTYCVEKLAEIGFDGYGYGGYAVNEQGQLDLDLSQFLAESLPAESYKFALGVGRPQDIVDLYKMGWQIFDCTLPTRDARHKRLYIKNEQKNEGSDFDYIYINKQKYIADMGPLSEACSCLTCKNYSRAYLHHLFKIKDTSAYRLATIHNLAFYTSVIESLQP